MYLKTDFLNVQSFSMSLLDASLRSTLLRTGCGCRATKQTGPLFS